MTASATRSESPPEPRPRHVSVDEAPDTTRCVWGAPTSVQRALGQPPRTWCGLTLSSLVFCSEHAAEARVHDAADRQGSGVVMS